MKRTFLVILMMFAQRSFASGADTLLHRVIIAANAAYAHPFGTLWHRSNNGYYSGQCRSGAGLDLLLSCRIYGHFYAAADVYFSSLQLVTDRVYAQMRQQFTQSGYFTTISLALRPIELSSGGIQCSYKINLFGYEAEPFISLNTAGMSQSYLNMIAIHEKEKNSNYSADVNVYYQNSSSFFFPCAGLRICKSLSHSVYGNICATYFSGNATSTLRYDRQDLSGNYSSSNSSYNQRISLLQLSAGVQLRIFKNRHHSRNNT